MNITLAKALRVESASCIAFIGAGGKTTAMFQVARQLPGPVIVTATSHLGVWQIPLADKHLIAEAPSPLEEIEHGLQGVILVTGPIENDRATPIPDDLLNWLYEFCGYHSIPLLVEADGARQKPLKAWAEHEPPVPPFAELVIQVAGLKAVGRLLNAEHVHRPEIFSRLSGLNMDEPVTAQSLVRVLVHPEGGLKNIPAGARRVVLLNQADTAESQAMGRALSQPLLSAYASVIVSDLRQEIIYAVHERIAGIVLAAGESKRFGEPKQLLDWRGQPFVRAVAKRALDAGLSPVVAVTGANAGAVRAALAGLDINVVSNAEWKDGQSSSIKAGVLPLTQRPPGPPSRSILEGPIRQGLSLLDNQESNLEFGRGVPHPNEAAAEEVGGAIFLLVDQPHVTTSILQALVEKHAEGLYPIVAPMVIDRRANPVLFDRATFPDLLELKGDVGGRALFHKYRVEYLPWHDDRLLLDVDTPEHYRRLLSDDTL
ncbi:MAG TPA: selenium cofactor biosynthesis protein YqeC [Anaerolineales bacterium]|nr:selenium cofactor biosynthesis protein YqeC [Anaerolineales bacterium]